MGDDKDYDNLLRESVTKTKEFIDELEEGLSMSEIAREVEENQEELSAGDYKPKLDTAREQLVYRLSPINCLTKSHKIHEIFDQMAHYSNRSGNPESWNFLSGPGLKAFIPLIPKKYATGSAEEHVYYSNTKPNDYSQSVGRPFMTSRSLLVPLKGGKGLNFLNRIGEEVFGANSD